MIPCPTTHHHHRLEAASHMLVFLPHTLFLASITFPAPCLWMFLPTILSIMPDKHVKNANPRYSCGIWSGVILGSPSLPGTEEGLPSQLRQVSVECRRGYLLLHPASPACLPLKRADLGGLARKEGWPFCSLCTQNHFLLPPSMHAATCSLWLCLTVLPTTTTSLPCCHHIFPKHPTEKMEKMCMKFSRQTLASFPYSVYYLQAPSCGLPNFHFPAPIALK